MTQNNLTYVINRCVFRCSSTTAGRFTWSTDDGTCRAGSVAGTRRYWARCGGMVLGRKFPSLQAALIAAVKFKGLMGVRPMQIADAPGRPSAHAQGALFERMAA